MSAVSEHVVYSGALRDNHGNRKIGTVGKDEHIVYKPVVGPRCTRLELRALRMRTPMSRQRCR